MCNLEYQIKPGLDLKAVAKALSGKENNLTTINKVVFNDLAIELTRRCNMSCAHCLRGDAQDADIFLSAIDGLLNQTEAIGMLTLTGGEPLLNLEAMQYITNGLTSRGIPIMMIQIITNGREYSEKFIAIVKRFAEIVQLTQRYGYGRDVNESWRVQIGVSLDKFHESPDICKENYLKYKNALKEVAEVRQIRHGNAPVNVGRAKALPNTIDLGMMDSVALLQQVEVLSIGHVPLCGYYESYHLDRADQKIICCPMYLSAYGDVLPCVVCDSDYRYHGAVLCNAWEPIFEKILAYNAEHNRIHCPEADDYRLKIKLLMPKEQRIRENRLEMAKDAQDEPSTAPQNETGERARWIKPDEYQDIVKEAMTYDYLKHLKV